MPVPIKAAARCTSPPPSGRSTVFGSWWPPAQTSTGETTSTATQASRESETTCEASARARLLGRVKAARYASTALPTTSCAREGGRVDTNARARWNGARRGLSVVKRLGGEVPVLAPPARAVDRRRAAGMRCALGDLRGCRGPAMRGLLLRSHAYGRVPDSRGDPCPDTGRPGVGDQLLPHGCFVAKQRRG